ncbi:MAG TPA: sulfite exporter TauE/SafE family protein [Microvirga sp.]|nr:sulfite exporter TauE/SafE family protein [Microvirga sp.]
MLADLLLFVAIGFAAQIVDGAIGMAYGLVSTTVLLSFGVPVTTASASVHAAEVFTTGASALSHWRLGNVDRRLFVRLAPAGMLGGALGAFVLVAVPGEIMRPVVSLYLAVMGGVILWKALRHSAGQDGEPRHVATLGLFGGFVDAVGGGGWGPLVASTLVGRGTTARLAIGSTNAAEFLVTVTISGTFVVTLGLELWPVIAGLILGGVIAAPLAAYATRTIPDRPLMILVGVVIVLLSLREMARLFGGP